MVDMNKIADKLEDKYLVQQTEEAKEILAFVQFYRIQCALAESSDENSGLHKHIVSGSLPATHIWLKANDQICL